MGFLKKLVGKLLGSVRVRETDLAVIESKIDHPSILPFPEIENPRPMLTPAENELGGWNYRIVRHKTDMKEWYNSRKLELPKDSPEIEYTYQIHEAYYDKQGKVHAITEEEVGPSGDSIEELKRSMELYKQALDRPVLDYDNIPEPGALPIDTITVQDLDRVAPKASDIIAKAKGDSSEKPAS